MTYHDGGYIPLAASMPVHLDDDECVLRHGVEGWHCVRVLHIGQPCRTPSTIPTLNERQPEAAADGQPTTATHPQRHTPATHAQPDPPTLTTHPTLGSGTHPSRRAEGRQDTGSSQADATRLDPTR